MSMTCFLEVNGSLRSGRKEKWFQLPETGLAARSVRFGNHALVVSAFPRSAGDTMQILPLGDTRRIRCEPQNRLETDALSEGCAGRVAALISRSKLLSFLM